MENKDVVSFQIIYDGGFWQSLGINYWENSEAVQINVSK